MPLTLAEAKVGVADKVNQQVIDEFRRNSELLNELIFDDTVFPGTGGSIMTYGYVRLKTLSSELNQGDFPNEVRREKDSVGIIIFGGAFEIDRVIARTAGAVDEVLFQIREKVSAACNYFHMLVINGSAAATGTGYVTGTFNGLKKILAGSDTEFTSTVDISTSAKLDENYNAFLDELDSFIHKLAEKPDFLMMNSKMLTKVRSAVRRAGFYERTKNDFGNFVETYNGIKLLDAGEYYNSTDTVECVKTEEDGTSAIYAFKIGLDAFHGISPKGNKIIQTILPDFKSAGAVKKGEVEMMAAVVLKNSKKAGVLKGIKIMETSSHPT